MHDGQLFIDRYYYTFFAPHGVIDSYYPSSTTSWYPRHGYLDRATFNMTFRHPKKLRIASVGARLSEEPDAELKDVVVTRYQMKHPVALVTFALGPYERHNQMGRWDQGGSGEPVPIEFNSLPGSIKALKEDFVLAELDNSLRYFSLMFGKYPYPVFGAAYHPFFFGQGFPSMLMIPADDSADVRTYSFIAHETAHQWWGNIVIWRSYRDQWLSEGFAEYSGILYTGLRAGAGKRDDLINRMRATLKLPPQTLTGPGKGRLVDVGPIILGHRLSTQKTFGAYQTLIYDKGALVLRMLHFLFTDPATGNGEPFFTMMRDFVNRHRDGVASTDDFRLVANEHFTKTPIARMYRISSLDWFFSQWVYQSALPSYRLEYQLQDQPDGKVLLTGNVTQEGAPSDWFMVLPVGLSFGGKQTVFTTVVADGPKAPFSIKLPTRPTKVDLDPDRWVLSENTSTKRN
jgi:aminopeptidase N